MLTRLVLLLGLLALASSAHAGSVTLSWDPVVGATGYEVEMSVDGGLTWAKVVDVAASVCTGSPAWCKATYLAPDAGRPLFQYISKNANGKTIRKTAGTWHCYTCDGPGFVTNMGTQ